MEAMAKVLVAEDDALLSSFMVKRLREEGYDVKASFDGAAALEEVKKWQPDLLLLDILMPIKDGYAVLQEIRGDPSVAGTRVMVVSNLSGDEQNLAKAKGFGVLEFVEKANTTPSLIAEKVTGILH